MKRALVISKTDAWAKALWDRGYQVYHMHESFTPGVFEEVLCWKRVGADPVEYLNTLFGDEYDVCVAQIPESESVERLQRGAAMAVALKNLALFSSLRSNPLAVVIQSTDREVGNALRGVISHRRRAYQWMWALTDAERTGHRTELWTFNWTFPMQLFTGDERTLSAKGKSSWFGMAAAFAAMLPRGDVEVKRQQDLVQVVTGHGPVAGEKGVNARVGNASQLGQCQKGQ